MPIKTLLKYLKNGKIVAAGIDVLENEKMRKLNTEQNKVMSELFTMNNVIFTPHVAGWTKESYIKISQTLANKIIALKLD
jgi:D-3-phosphoglycerate dehydrogenase